MCILMVIFSYLFIKCGSALLRWYIWSLLFILAPSWKFISLPVRAMFCFKRQRKYSDESEEKLCGPSNKVITRQPEPLNCPNCAKLQDQKEKLHLAETSQECLRKIIERLQRELDKKDDIEEKYEDLKKRSDEITKTMAAVLQERGDLENINDEFSNAKLAKRMENLYSNTWTSLSEWIDDNKPDVNEFKRISILTMLMKCGYERCVKLASEELRVFLYLKDDDDLPSKDKDPTLYEVRRRYGQTKQKKEGIAKTVLNELLKKDELNVLLPEDETTKEQGLEMIKIFFMNYLECCWLMTISHHKLVLDFDAEGHKYEGYIKDRFKLFSCQDKVIDKTQPKDTITEVVWPSVELDDASAFLTKGDVIVVEIGKECESPDVHSESEDNNGDEDIDATLLPEKDNVNSINGEVTHTKL